MLKSELYSSHYFTKKLGFVKWVIQTGDGKGEINGDGKTHDLRW